MRITEVKVFPVTGKDDLLGYANIIIDDSICVRDLKIRREAAGFKIAKEAKQKAHFLNNPHLLSAAEFMKLFVEEEPREFDRID